MPIDPSEGRVTVAVEDLRVGMVLAEPVLTTLGSILLAEGERLTEDQLDRVLSFSSNAVLQTKIVAVIGALTEA